MLDRIPPCLIQRKSKLPDFIHLFIHNLSNCVSIPFDRYSNKLFQIIRFNKKFKIYKKIFFYLNSFIYFYSL